jgi:hypothetical protein
MSDLLFILAISTCSSSNLAAEHALLVFFLTRSELYAHPLAQVIMAVIIGWKKRNMIISRGTVFRNQVQNLWSRMNMSAPPPINRLRLTPSSATGSCFVCLGEISGRSTRADPCSRDEVGLQLRCSCVVHLHCCVGYARSHIEDKSLVRKEGLRCPLCHHIKPEGFIDTDDLRELDLLAKEFHTSMSDLVVDPLTQSELNKLSRWMVECAISELKGDLEEEIVCPLCSVPYLSEVRQTAYAEKEEVVCPNCTESFCKQCRCRWHGEVACREKDLFKRRVNSEAASEAFIKATSKKCPNCKTPTTHYHGHECHHIQGCTTCGQHFCYVCLAKHPTNFKLRVRTGWGCEHRSSNCDSTNILSNLVLKPYPRDKSCGCPICMDCRRDSPCELCSGHCVVCRGIVAPGKNFMTETSGLLGSGKRILNCVIQ